MTVLTRFSIAGRVGSVAGIIAAGWYLQTGAAVAAAQMLAMAGVIEVSRSWAVAPGDESRIERGVHAWGALAAASTLAYAVTVEIHNALVMLPQCLIPLVTGWLAGREPTARWLVRGTEWILLLVSVRWLADAPADLSTLTPRGLAQPAALAVMTVALYLFGVTERATIARLVLTRAHADELASARDAAVAATRAKSDFLAMMTHELRTPFHGVTAALDLLQRSDMSVAVRRRVDMAMACADQACRVIDGILDYSHIEAGAISRDEIVFSTRELVEQAVDVVRPIAEQKRLTMTVAITGAPDRLVGDATKIRQVLVNLLGNAVKFTERGSVAVEAHWARDRLTVAVTDTGVGIDPSQRQRVFEMFEQHDTSTTRAFGGTGLGLAISGQLVQLMDGDIGVESIRGEGSRFRFTLRAPEPADGRPAVSLAPLTALGPVPRPPSDPRTPEGAPLVLVVDDNPTNAAIATDMLQDLGCGYLWAADGPEALRELDRRPDIVALLLDCHLPGVHGSAVARLVRARTDHHRRAGIVGLTADPSPATITGALAAGMDLCIGKPARLAVIRDALREVDVLPTPFDTTPLVEARALLMRDAGPDATDRAATLVADALDEATALVDGLRHVPGASQLFHKAHGHLAGSLVYAAELLRHGRPDGRQLAYVLESLDRAVHWEDGGPAEADKGSPAGPMIEAVR
jgi:signal transduction histidine kinase